jgi:hypothetical protein
MNLLFISDTVTTYDTWPIYTPYMRIRNFPASVYDLYCSELFQSRKYDITLWYIPNGVHYLDKLPQLKNLTRVKCVFHSGYEPFNNTEDIFTNVITSYNIPSNLPSNLPTFWSPPCVSIYPYTNNKDIDILFWGKNIEDYPFRQFVYNTLNTKIVAQLPSNYKSLLNYKINLNNKDYNYSVLLPNNEFFYSSELYNLISRSKICCTGSHITKVASGKFFENATCGSISLTDKFNDVEILGFEHGKNIWFTDTNNFLTDLEYLLENEDIVISISANAKELIKKKHSLYIRTKELYKYLCAIVGETE